MKLAKVKKPLSLFIAALFALTALWGGAAYAFKFKAASAADTSFKAAALSIANGEFNSSSSSSSSSSFPKSPSDWTGAAAGGADSSGLYHGVISMKGAVYYNDDVLKDYHLGDGVHVPKNPFSDPQAYPDASKIDSGENALMINTKAAAGAFAYTSGSLTLEANKYYKISAWVLTFKFTDSGASVRLVDADTNLPIGTKAKFDPDPAKNIAENLLAFNNIDTSEYKDEWREYKFFVQTSFTPMNIKVSLGIGGDGRTAKGVAFFDHVTGTTVRRTDFEDNAKVSAENFLSYSFVTEGAKRGRVTADNTSFIQNGEFKSGMDNWTWINDKDKHPDWWGPKNSLRPNNPGEPGVAALSAENAVSPFGRTETLRIKNHSASASGVISAPFSLQRFRYYRLSVWYLTLDGGQANLYLSTPDTAKTDNSRITISSISSLSSGENSDMENWQQATFYIKGSSIKDYDNVSLELWLGWGSSKSAGTHSAGTVYFDKIEIQYLDSAEYAKYSGNGTAVSLGEALDNLNLLSSITNGNFLDVEYTDFDDFDLTPVKGIINYRPNAPLSPSSWTFSSGEDKSLNAKAVGFKYNDTAVSRGVIAGNETYSGAPGSKYASTALTVQNNGLSAAGYTSPDISVSPDSFQKISVSVSTKGGAKAFLQLTENGSPVSTIENITTKEGQWEIYSFIVKTGGDTSSLKLTLWNGWCSEDVSNPKKNLSAGAVYFAKADSEPGNEADYNAAVADDRQKTSKPVDMESNFGLFGNSDGALKTPFRYYGAGVSGGSDYVSGGILDTKSFTTVSRDDLGTDNPGTTSDSLRYVLTVNNKTATAYKYTYSKSKTLNASSYYKVTVSVQTAEVSGAEKGRGFGAYIALNGIPDAVFSGIVTDEIKKDSEGKEQSTRQYKTYTFLIATGDSPMNFNYELGLGDVKRSSSWTKGYAFFEDMKVVPSDKMEYNGTSADVQNLMKLSFITSAEKAPETSEKDKSAWDWMWLPTVLFGLALLFVLVMVGIRRVAPAMGRLIQKNKTAKAATYDREESTKASKRRTPKASAGDDGYIDVVETVRAKPETKADKEEKADGAETKPDAYTDYFED